MYNKPTLGEKCLWLRVLQSVPQKELRSMGITVVLLTHSISHSHPSCELLLYRKGQQRGLGLFLLLALGSYLLSRTSVLHVLDVSLLQLSLEGIKYGRNILLNSDLILCSVQASEHHQLLGSKT
ncbi:hypothetical protein ILYODFUR_033555 [Ilyodon furcidens]|uniref:Uncharacterized protein n=1 Tax=Ilyodon furcidens TaxID=33524 RepID=A0ABV0TD77_9TELE